MAKLIEPIFILENAAEDALIVAEEDKGHKAADGDTELQALASTKPGPHSVLGVCARCKVSRCHMAVL